MAGTFGRIIINTKHTNTMELKNFASTLASENDFIKASFGGFAGSGKTRTASEFVVGCYKKMKLTKPVLIIDNEKGSRFLVSFFEKAGIKTLVKETVHLADVLTAFDYITKREVDFLFIDSLTKVWYQFVRDYREKNNRKFMTLQDWGKILPDWQEKFADKFVSVEGNIIFTGRGGYTYDMEENEETKKKEFVKSGVKMKMAGETPFETDLNIWMEIAQEITHEGRPKIWREALVMKDRSGTIDGNTIINPTFKDFEPVMNFLIGIKKGDIAKASDTTNLAASEEYDNRRKQREILNEKIKAEFDKRGFGTTKEDKQLKALMSEIAFGTTSSTEFESMSVSRMELGYTRILELFTTYDQSEDKINAIKAHVFSFFATPQE